MCRLIELLKQLDRKESYDRRAQLRITISLVLALATFAVYFQVIGDQFLTYDDPTFVSQNAHVYTGLSEANLKWDFSTLNGDTAYYHPLTWLSHQLDCQFFGLTPGAHHVSNLCLHLANSLLLFALLVTVTGKTWRSAVVAALFALHPLHIETVAWLSERKSLLCTFFWMLTTLTYFRYARNPKVLTYLLMALLYICALLAKPLAVTLPFTFLLWDYWPLGRVFPNNTPVQEPSDDGKMTGTLRFLRQLTPLIIEKIPLLFLALAGSWLAILAQKDLGAMSSLNECPVNQRINSAIISCFLYVRKMFFPVDLSIMYPFRYDWNWWQVAGCGLFLCSLSILAFTCMQKRPYIFFGWFWYLGTLVPMLGFVRVGSAAMADRYTYLTMIGLFIAIVWGLAEFAAHPRVRPRARLALPVLATGVVLLCAVSTAWSLPRWKNTLRLFASGAEATDRNYLGYYQLAGVYLGQGNLVVAEDCNRRSIEMLPHMGRSRASLGSVLFAKGDIPGAFEEFDLAMKIDPNNSDGHTALAIALVNSSIPKYQDVSKAVEHAKRACELTKYRQRSPITLLIDICLNNDKPAEAKEAAARLLAISVSPQELSEARKFVEAARKLEVTTNTHEDSAMVQK